MPLAPGQILSQYEILRHLGDGGMGQVYCARDTLLGREVAIKVLPDEMAGDEERLRRFEREARILASLNHPNVAHVYGFDRVGGACFMAMELVPGEDLGTILARGPIPVAEAIEVCRQIAEGLEAAHEAGVIHRDLKPANVVVTPEGKAKVLDFGVAKSVRLAADGDAPQPSVLTTEAGTVLGTPAYMAPEQARGRRIDRRVDVWAFGCVFFECLTGRRAFEGNLLGEVVAAVLAKDPDWNRLPPGTPDHVRTLLGRCLDKEPRTRLRDIGEARFLLEHAPSPRVAAPAPGSGRRRLLAGALIAAAFGAGAVAGGFRPAEDLAPTPRAIHLRRLTEIAGMEESPALSPDGKAVAFVTRVDGKRQIFLRTKGAPDQLTRGPSEHSAPRWIDESTLIYFRHPDADGEPGSIQEKIILSATPPRPILAPAQGEADVSHDGRTIATFRSDEAGPALVLVERGGARGEIVRRLPVPGRYSSPRWSPDDRFIAFEAAIYLSKAEIRVMEVEGGETRTVARPAQVRGIAWLPDGSGIVYASSEGSTLAYPPIFRLRTVKFDDGHDAPVPLPDAGYASYVEPDVGAGRLVASRMRLDSDIYRYPIDGSARENVSNARRITRQTGIVQVPSVSPDDEEVVYVSDSGDHANLWVARVDGSGTPRQITDETDPLVVIGVPQWSPRDDLIVYWRGRQGADAAELLIAKSDGSGTRPLVSAGAGACWSADGEWIYHIARDGVTGPEPATHKIRIDGGESVLVRRETCGLSVSPDESTGYFSPSTYRQGEVWKVSPIETGTAVPLVTNLQDRIPLWPHQYHVSPDGRWLATPLRDEGTTNIWLISTEDGEMKQVTDFERRSTLIGRQVSWSSDSRHIFAALMEIDADIVLLEGALP